VRLIGRGAISVEGCVLASGDGSDGKVEGGLYAGVAVEFVANEFAEFVNGGLFDLVKDLGAAFFTLEEFGVMKDAELLGDVGLRGVEGLDEFIYGFGPGLEFLEDGEAGGFGEGAENVSDSLKGLAIHLLMGGRRERRNFFGDSI
jgi:hypothetical protein